MLPIRLMGQCMERIYAHLARTRFWSNLLMLFPLLLTLVLLYWFPLPLLRHRRRAGFRCSANRRAILLLSAVLSLKMKGNALLHVVQPCNCPLLKISVREKLVKALHEVLVVLEQPLDA